MKYYPIDEKLAKQAKQYWSFFDYVDGSTTASYKKQVDDCYALVDGVPEDCKEKAEYLADRYAQKLAEWYNKEFRIQMMCPSVLVTGGSNFPVHKKEKQNAAEDRHMELWNEIQAIPDRIKKLSHTSGVIKSDDENAVEMLQAKIDKLESLQAEMKKANAYYRKHKTMVGYGTLTEEQAKERDEIIKGGYSWEQQPYPSYYLTNNNAKIRQAKARLDELERLKNAPQGAEMVVDTDLFKVVENTDIMRLQLIFDGKPSEEVRTILKSYGYRWSPSNGAWQRQLTENAKESVSYVLKEIEGLE